jgi:adenylate cyclase
MLRGRTEVIRAFEPLTHKPSVDPASKSYQKAFALLEDGDARALAAFATHVGKYPNDHLASFHLKRLLGGTISPKITLD